MQLIRAEGEGVVQQDIDRLLDIWADDGQIVDANHTSDNRCRRCEMDRA